MSNFQSFGLCAPLLTRLQSCGFISPTPIQGLAIGDVLAGHDILAAAQTGTGKTAAFGLPILDMILSQKPGLESSTKLTSLILTPTRELAQQVFDELSNYAPDEVKLGVAYGGVSINQQQKMLRQGVDILVATPGRLLDHMFTGLVDLSALQYFVLDEADRMLDMGFMPDLQRIMRRMNQTRQTLLFSATFSPEVKKIAQKLLTDPKVIQVGGENEAAKTVTQMLHPVNKSKKAQALAYLIGSKNYQQALVFVKTKQGADELAKSLKKDGLKASAIHGDKSQGARQKALDDFKSGSLRVLVATDVAARGIDISQLPVVINYELPFKAEDYVHRIGRTGRAGESGMAISLMAPQEEYLLEAIERLLDIRIPQSWLEGFEPNFEEKESQSFDANQPQKRRGRSYEKRKLKAKLKIHAQRGKKSN